VERTSKPREPGFITFKKNLQAKEKSAERQFFNEEDEKLMRVRIHRTLLLDVNNNIIA
jgi:hypothetical protein